MISNTIDRVRENTDWSVNRAIDRATVDSIRRAASGGMRAIDCRLEALNREWDIERCLETVAPTISLTGMALSVTRDRKWLLLPIIVQSFFLMHALQGWCPPLPILRRLGVRTASEIDEERNALKVLRGDYEKSDSLGEDSVEQALQAVRV